MTQGNYDPNSPGVGFNIDNFRSQINAVGGILKPTKYLLYLTPPPKMTTGPLSNFGTQGAEAAQFLVSAAKLPGIEAIGHDVRRYGYGAIQKLAWMPGFGPVPLQVMCDAAGLEWTFFKQWMSLIINFDMSKGITAVDPISNTSPYEIGYLVDYAVNAEVIVFDNLGHGILNVTLRNAYPIGISDMSLDWADNNIARFNVFLQFQDWSQTNLEAQESFGLPQTT